MNILVLDNYDSFTYNLVHYISDITGKTPDVYRNDQIEIQQIKEYDALILSPGPGIPSEAGILKEAIRSYAGKIPIFGVCLGLQAIAEVFGGTLQNLDKVYHGVASKVYITQNDAAIFKSIPTAFQAGRYHSWIVSKTDFPDELEMICQDENEYIMGLRHKTHFIEAVQFHPESILTPDGKEIISNFIHAISKR